MTAKQIKVLLIEDNPRDTRQIREMLSEVSGAAFDMEYADRLLTGLELLTTGVFDVILLDLGLPDCSGLNTFTRVHAQSPEVPIVILTGLDDVTVAIKAVRDGAQDYLPKNQLDSNLLSRSMNYAIERAGKLKHIEHLNNVLKAIRSINQLIMIEKDRGCLLQKACDVLIEARGYDSAWLGLLQDNETFAIIAGSGIREDVARFCEHVMGGDYPPCIKTALVQNQKDLLVIVDKSKECKDCFFNNTCTGKEAAVIRVEYADRLFGLLVISMASDVATNEEEEEEEKELLKEVTGDIAFALHDMELEEARKQAEEVLRLNEYRLEALLELGQMTESSLEQIAEFTLEKGVELTKSKIGYFGFMNEDETSFSMYAWSKSAMAECAIVDKPLLYPVEGEGFLTEPIRQRKPVIINDFSALDARKKGFPEGHVQVFRYMNIPVFDGDRIVILAGVGNKQAEYDESDIRQLALLMNGLWRIIQRKRVEEALRESEAQYHGIFDSATDSFLIFDLDGNIVDANPQACKMYGYSHDALIKLSGKDIIHPDYYHLFEQFKRDVQTTGEFYTESVDVRKDGTTFNIEIRGAAFYYMGKPHLLAVIRDITRRKQEEKELKQTVVDLEAYVEQMKVYYQR